MPITYIKAKKTEPSQIPVVMHNLVITLQMERSR